MYHMIGERGVVVVGGEFNVSNRVATSMEWLTVDDDSVLGMTIIWN